MDPFVEQIQKENKELKDKIASLKEKFDSELMSRSQTLKLQSSFEKLDSQHKV
jgi:cell division septum initiation protein DivIVA